MDLIERIREICRERGWYGPQMEESRRVAADDPRRKEFARPPATAQQLAATEMELGFILPATLRTLYAELGNGGFGPGYGLRGVVGGLPVQGTITDMYPFSGNALFPFSNTVWERWEQNPHHVLEFSANRWPEKLLPICKWGCGSEIGLHAERGWVFHIGSARHPTHWAIWVLADSLEAWLEWWIQEEDL